MCEALCKEQRCCTIDQFHDTIMCENFISLLSRMMWHLMLWFINGTSVQQRDEYWHIILFRWNDLYLKTIIDKHTLTEWIWAKFSQITMKNYKARNVENMSFVLCSMFKVYYKHINHCVNASVNICSINLLCISILCVREPQKM